MGAITQRQSSAQFYRIVDGSICLKSDTERDGYELFTTQNPQTKQPVSYYIKRFDGLQGFLTAFDRVDKPDKQVHGWQLTLSDEDGNYALSLKDNNSATTRVLKMLRSVDISKPLTVRAWMDTKGERPKTAIKFEQDGANVPQNFDASNLPKPKERPNGKLDFSESEDVLYQDAIEFGKLLWASAVKVDQRVTDDVDAPEPPDEYTGTVDDGTDIPF